MMELVHTVALYRKSLANGGPDYAGKWVLITFTGERLVFTGFETEEEAVAKLEQPDCPDSAFVIQFPSEETIL